VEFLELPPFKGPWQYLRNYLLIRKKMKIYIADFQCGIFRMPGATSNIAAKIFSKTKKPFAIEVVADPWEAASKGMFKSILRPIIRNLWTYSLKRKCMQANGVSYVTRRYLQDRYPCHAWVNSCKNNYFMSSYSSVELPDDKFATARKHVAMSEIIISHVANSFETYGKGHLTLIKALSVILDHKYNVRVIFVGDGSLKSEFMNVAKEWNVDKNIVFLGRLPNSEAVREVIRDSDLFVFPTKAEGLPRVLLEAMAEGVPCISSPVCGIPEILSEDCLIEYSDYNGFAFKIMELINNPKLLDKHSKLGINTAKKYSSDILSKKRKDFYLNLRATIK
ncbi:MAG: glycosyltransferase family 4 protein, partial [Oscillospiraceae bacterium]|nr:glycosyltransferase family 4 protein [Oscillospiraceae bacterium]